MAQNNKRLKKRYLLFLFVTAVIILMFVRTDIAQIFTLERFKMHALTLQKLTSEHYILMLLSYFFVFIMATILFIPVTIVLTILAGFLFGVGPGTFYACTAATVGGAITFLIVRYIIGEKLHARYASVFKRIDKELKRHGARYLLFLQISPVTPTPIINTAVGLTHISLWTYVWTTFLGILPGSLIYALAGQKLQAITTVEDIMPPILFALLLTISLIGILPLIFHYLMLKIEKLQ